MSAPHLPPKSCNVKNHQRLLALPQIMLTVAFSLFAGMTAAIVTNVWILPPTAPDTLLPSLAGRGSLQTLEPGVVNQTHERLLQIYDVNKLAPGAYGPDSFIGNAAILSSDGWAVAAIPYQPGQEKQWTAFDHQGLAYRVEQAVFDPVTKLTYLRFHGSNFRVLAFPSWQNISPGTAVWVVPRLSWFGAKQSSLAFLTEGAKTSEDTVYAIWETAYQFGVSPTAQFGSVVITDRGELAGFIGGNSMLIPGWYVSAALAPLLSGRKLQYTAIAVEGVVADHVVVDGGFAPVSGFYVSQVKTPGTQLKKGDVIVRINNLPVGRVTVSRDVLLSDAVLTLTVWRDKTEQEIVVQKIVVP